MAKFWKIIRTLWITFGILFILLGDNAATISREAQQELTVEAILATLNGVQGK